MDRSFYIVDVFAEERFSGNQLAVFLNGEQFTPEEMQQIAAEMNYSETTFISSKKIADAHFDIRIFTPTNELPFAGHPMLGTAFVIASHMLKPGVEEVTLRCPVGDIPVRLVQSEDKIDYLEMKQNPPEFGSRFNSFTLTKILSTRERAIDSRFPIQEVSTGIPFIIVPLRTLAAVQDIHLDTALFGRFVANKGAKALLVFCPETIDPENRLHVRVFAPLLGVNEDPATGSANGCLAAYLIKNNYFSEDSIDLSVEQGIEMGRKSKLYLKAARTKNDSYDIYVGGKVMAVAEGKLS